ncbi:MAG: enoyl-CoA hydratase-related protein [Acidobacteria bacterium]|nr:enoyl-CoA hydratase-related protein [Acidobacteriota bacterium]
MAYDLLILERAAGVAVVTLNRPAVLNALNLALLRELDYAMTELRDDDSIRAVILTGAGEKAFVAGADIKELAELTPVAGKAYAATGQRIFATIEQLGKPVIAAINGYALGGGCELAMACTIRLASETARFGQPEVKLGIIPGFGGTQRLPRLVGKGRAMELVLTGVPIDAAEALRIGLVNRVVPAAALMTEARALAQALAASAPVALRHAMEAIDRGLEMTVADGCVLEGTLFGLVASTDDMREGTRAFVEKRKAAFTGR